MSEEIRELRVSNDAKDDPAELQSRIADEGYLFFKQLQNPDKMRELRLVMMTKIQDVGWLLPDTHPLKALPTSPGNALKGISNTPPDTAMSTSSKPSIAPPTGPKSQT